MLDHVFHSNGIAYSQQNRYVQFAIYTDLFILSEMEIKVLRKGLDFPPIQNKINVPELKDFQEFCGRMRIKWHVRYDVTPQFSEIPAITPKSK